MPSFSLAQDRDFFYRGIAAIPEDDLPRLVFADWLDEKGESERAEFLRNQIFLHKRQPHAQFFGRRRTTSPWGEGSPEVFSTRPEDLWTLEMRTRRLFGENFERWLPEIPGPLRDIMDDAFRASIHRLPALREQILSGLEGQPNRRRRISFYYSHFRRGFLGAIRLGGELQQIRRNLRVAMTDPYSTISELHYSKTTGDEGEIFTAEVLKQEFFDNRDY